MADGMGGHAAGNIASNLVVSTFNKRFTGSFGKEEPSNLLRAGLEKANDALKDSIKETSALDGMGCTMVTAAFTRSKVYWASVGDSHLYVVRDRELVKKNEDHSYGGYLDRMKAQGMEVEAEAGLSRNMLMSAMTGDDIAEIDCPSKGFQLLPGDRVIVASDGLDTLSAGVILQTCAWSSSAKECVQALLAKVDEAKKPRQDNTTVIVCDVARRDAPTEKVVAEVRERGDTQPLDLDALKGDMARERDAGGIGGLPQAAEPKRGKGLLVGVAVALLLAIAAAGAWFMLGGGVEPPVRVAQRLPEPAPVPTPPPAPEPAATEPAVTEPAAIEPTATQPAATEPAVTEPATGEPDLFPLDDEPSTPATAEPAGQPEVGRRAPTSEPFRDALASGRQGPLMVSLPGGTFEMGGSSLSVAADERPRHSVTVRPFAIGQHEITFQEYERFARATGRKAPDNLYLDKENHPVISVSWDDAYAYTQWLSNQTGQRYRLPSEAEWEYASSAGATSPFWWGYEIGENRAHCFDCKTGLNPRQPARIGRFEPNAFGLYDTAGNVSEWVHDCHHPNYQGAPQDGSVWEGGDCAYRVVRGGAYSDTSKSIRPASRKKFRSQQGYDFIGFRVARDL
jgi:formylglycine-generating enzyme required for sulfatase activity/serine/threonine protein phosphatase PrpC